MDFGLVQRLRARRDEEVGGIRLSDAPLRVTLAYPSPYHVAMSSLGYLWVYRLINEMAGVTCRRAMQPDREEAAIYDRSRTPLLTVEDQSPAGRADVFAISQAYELELAGVAEILERSGIPPRAADRGPEHPLVVLGGPITFSNPMPSGYFADVVVLGEAEDTLVRILRTLCESPVGTARAREAFLEEIHGWPGVWIPKLQPRKLPAIARASGHFLPAVSTLRTPNTELKNMVLIEPERGCHRGCTFCVMRRSTNGGMRLFPVDRILSLIPDDATRVGLVGAAVTDHPGILDLLRCLVEERGMGVGISSLRADRLSSEFVRLLTQGGYRSLTVALDAASVRLRDEIEKNIKNEQIRQVARWAKAHGMRHLKVYVIVGLPGETDEDRNELVGFVNELSQIIPVVLGVSPFVPKYHTPLASAPFAGEAQVGRYLRQLRQGLAPQAKLRGPGAREAYIEYRLSQGGVGHGEAALVAMRDGGALSAWKRALKGLPERDPPLDYGALVPAPTLRRGRLRVA